LKTGSDKRAFTAVAVAATQLEAAELLAGSEDGTLFALPPHAASAPVANMPPISRDRDKYSLRSNNEELHTARAKIKKPVGHSTPAFWHYSYERATRFLRSIRLR